MYLHLARLETTVFDVKLSQKSTKAIENKWIFCCFRTFATFLGLWSVVCGRSSIWSVVGGEFLVWSVVGGFHGRCGRWSVSQNVVGGRFLFLRMVGGRFLFLRMVDGRWSVSYSVYGRWSVAHGRWSVVGGWSVGGGFVLRPNLLTFVLIEVR